MNTAKFAILGAIALMLVGCAGTGTSIGTSQDKFTGKTINETSGNDLPMGIADPGAAFFAVRQELDEHSTAQYFIMIGSYSLQGAVLIPNPLGPSLYVVADKQRFEFSTLSHQGNRYFYPSTLEQMRSIALATNVEIRVIQVSGTPYEKKLSAKNRANLHSFAEKYLP